jgi:hypothetical protein
LALHEKKAPMALVARRMEERQKRPLREHVRDQVEIALEEEQNTLADAQKKLTNSIVMTKNMINLLKEKLEDLRADIESKMQALSVDELCLRTTHRSWIATADSCTPTSRVSTGARLTGAQSAATQLSQRNEIKRTRETKSHDTHARKHEEASADLREENQLIVQRSSKASKDAKAKTEKCLQERVSEMRQMKKRLEIQLKTTEQKADSTQATSNETQYSIHQIQEPIALTATHTSWRKQRSQNEQIIDPVEKQLEHQKLKLMSASEELRGHRHTERRLITALGEQIERLREDLREKNHALSIDVACLEYVSDASWNGSAKGPRSAQTSPMKSSRKGRTPMSKLGMVDPYTGLPQITSGSLSAR